MPCLAGILSILAARGDASNRIRGTSLDLEKDVIEIIVRVLDLGGRAAGLTSETRLLGSVPELDSMAVATLITSIEEHFGFVIEDDEIDGSVFATVGSLVDFVRTKLSV